MNIRFDKYVENLTPAKKILAREAVEEYLKGESEEVDVVRGVEDAVKKFRFISNKEEEHFAIIYLNTSNRVLTVEEINSKSLSNVLVDVRTILREALLRKATRLIVGHNHPSGNLKPSFDDDRLTNRLKEACQIMSIHLNDHIIVSGDKYYSYMEDCKL